MASHALSPHAPVYSAGDVPSVAPSGGEKEAAPVGIHKAALDNLAAVYHTFASLGGVVTLLACLFDIAAKENTAGPALSGLASNNVSPPAELGLSRICPKNADIGSGHRKMRGITRRHAQTSSSFATNATFSGAAAHIIEVRTQPLSSIPSPLG